jgi:hypothetical protein
MTTDADFIRCRVMRHSWDDFSPTGLRNPSWGTRVSYRCLRCTAERHDIYNSLGEVGYRRYIYPAGYQYAKGDRPSAAEFRIMLMKQQRKERVKAREAAKKRAPASKGRLRAVK